MQTYWLYGLLIPFGVAIFLRWRGWYEKYDLWLKVFPAVILIGTPVVMVLCHLVYFILAGLSRAEIQEFFFTLDGWRDGYASFGLMIGAILTVCVVSVLYRLPVKELLDLYSPGAFVASAIWRIDCFVDGCCYGAPTSMPWGFSFTVVEEMQIVTPRCHPTQLYEVGVSLLILIILPTILKKLKTRPGEMLIFFGAIFLYSLERFVLEFFRIGGSTEALGIGLSLTQVVTLVGGLVSVVAFLIVYRGRGDF